MTIQGAIRSSFHSFLILAAIVWSLLPGSVRAQVAPVLVAGGGTPEGKGRQGFAFWSMQLTNHPPMPFVPFAGLEVYEATTPGQFFYDDRLVDYAALRAEWAKVAAENAALQSELGFGEAAPEGGGPQMMQMLSSPCGTNLCLGLETVGEYAVLTLYNTRPGTNYQIFSRPDLYDHSLSNGALSSAVLEQELVGVEEQDFTRTVIPMNGRSHLFFRARETDYHAPPFLHISDVRAPVLPEPWVQVRGYSESALASVTWSVTNGAGGTNGRGYVLRQHYDAAQGKLTTNWWQCFDVPLAPGMNRITVQAVDREGHTNSTTLQYAYVFAPNRAAPAPTLTFPAAGQTLAGTNVTLRGTVDNPTARVLAEVALGGVTRRVAGVVERDGTFWIDNLLLAAGTNAVTLLATDAGGLSSTNVFTVLASTVEFTITSPGVGAFLHHPAINLEGTAPDGYTVTINGVTTNASGGYWAAQAVPIPRGGVAMFTAEAAGGGETLVTTLALDKPTKEFLAAIDRYQSQFQDWTACDATNFTLQSFNKTNEIRWTRGAGGSDVDTNRFHYFCGDPEQFSGYVRLFGPLDPVDFRAPPDGCGNCLPGPYAEHGFVNGQFGISTDHGVKNAYYRLRSQSRMHLQAGGRSIAGRQAVARFDGSGTEYLVLTDPLNLAGILGQAWNWWLNPNYATPSNLVAIPPAHITVLGRALGSNGVLYERVPAGVEVDCTPDAPGDLWQITLTAADATPRLWMDWDNDNQGSSPENDETERWLKFLPPSVENPGKVLFASTGDSNGDGVPDFADGYGVFGGQSNGAARPLVPLVIDLPLTVDTNRLRLTLAHDFSSPGGVTFAGNVDDGFTFTPAGGTLRLWTRNGNEARTNAFVESGGNLISPATSYGFADLPFETGGSGYQLRLYVESVRPSTVIGDQIVTLYADADGPEGGSAEGKLDEVFFTTLDTVLVSVDSGGNTTPTAKLEVSHPSPLVTVSACSVGGVQASADYQSILGTLTLSGAVHSAVCDYTPGTNGTIDEVRVYVNSYDEPVAVLPVAVTKITNAASFLQPFAYAGAFATNLAGVELELGVNLIRVTAVDKAQGITGYAEYTVEVTGQKTNQLLQSYADAGVGLDFGGLTNLSQLTGSTPVTLGFTNFAASASYNGTLYKVSDTPLVLSNASAWVSIPDSTALDAALSASGAARFDASVSVPALAPLNIGFTLERATNSGPFTFQFVELQLTAHGPLDGTAPDTVTAQLRKGGGTWQTATLTNSSGATNLFKNTAGTYALELAYTPSLTTTQIDQLIVTVTNTTLAIAGDVLGLTETATNSQVFASDPGLLFLDDDWRDWTFGSGTATALAASDGGVFKPYALQFQGPPALLDAVTNLALLNDQGQPIGDRQIVKKDTRHFLKSAVGTVNRAALFFSNPAALAFEAQYQYSHINNLNDLGQFYLGFGVGFYQGGVSLVEGGATLSVIAFKFSRAGLQYELATGQNYRQEINTLVTTAKAIKPLVDFWIEWKTRQLTEIYNAPNATEATLRAVSEDMALLARLGKEVIIYLEQYDATNTVYNRGKLQGRVAFEVASLLIAEIKLAQAGQAAKLLSKLRFSEGLLARCQAALPAPELARATPALEAAVAAAKGVPVAGQIGQFTRTTTPAGRSVWQRADIDWTFRRKNGLTNLEAAERGLAPMRQNGAKLERCELHHLNQDPHGSFTEVWAFTHDKVPHNLVPPPSWRTIYPELEAAYRKEQKAYWQWRASQAQP